MGKETISYNNYRKPRFLSSMTKLKISSVKTTSEFIKEVDKIVTAKKCEYIDAVLIYCEQNGVEIETAASLIRMSSKMKARIQNEAEEQNYMKKRGKLHL